MDDGELLSDNNSLVSVHTRLELPVEYSTRGRRVIRRNNMIAPTIATHPYSSTITQPGRAPQGRPSMRKCH
jgi:hypothetical protein